MSADFTKRTLHQAEVYAYDMNTDAPTRKLLLDLITVVTNLELDVEELTLKLEATAQ